MFHHFNLTHSTHVIAYTFSVDSLFSSTFFLKSLLLQVNAALPPPASTAEPTQSTFTRRPLQKPESETRAQEKDSGQQFVVPVVNLLHETAEPARTNATYVQQRLAGEPRSGFPTNIQPTNNQPKKDKPNDSFELDDDILQSLQQQPNSAKLDAPSAPAHTFNSNNNDHISANKKVITGAGNLSSLLSVGGGGAGAFPNDSLYGDNAGNGGGVVLGGGNKLRLGSLNPSANAGTLASSSAASTFGDNSGVGGR